MKTKRFSTVFGLLAVAAVLFTSCLKNEDDNSSVSYADMAITSFTLGSLNRYVHTTSVRTGNDTVSRVTFTGSLYPMAIDHLHQRIYNTKPLPLDTDTKHVVCTIGTKNNGVVYLKSTSSDSLFYHQSADSVDLSQPRVFRVFAINGSGSRDYTVSLSVGASSETHILWAERTAIGPVADMADRQLVAQGDSVVLADRSVAVSGGKQYGPFDGVSLIGASSHELYGYDAAGVLVRSADHGQSWQAEATDDDASLLPRQNVSIVSWPYGSADSTDYVLMVGSQQDETADGMSIWRKIAPYGGTSQWVLMTQDDVNRQKLPRTAMLSLACYDGTVLAMTDGMTIYQSRDQGITWQRPAGFALPAGVSGTQARIAADTSGRLWVVTDAGQVWQGVEQ